VADAAVANASPLILLSRARHFELLRVAAASVFVPEPVLGEIEAKGRDDITVLAVRQAPWVTVVPASPVSTEIAEWELGGGESSVLQWAREHAGSLALLDDLEGRRCAESLGIPVLGTVGLVLLARRRGIVPLARPVLEQLIAVGMYLSERTLTAALRRVGE